MLSESCVPDLNVLGDIENYDDLNKKLKFRHSDRGYQVVVTAPLVTCVYAQVRCECKRNCGPIMGKTSIPSTGRYSWLHVFCLCRCINRAPGGISRTASRPMLASPVHGSNTAGYSF